MMFFFADGPDPDEASRLVFDYRPFVVNWCLNLKVLDGYKVTPKERQDIFILDLMVAYHFII